MMKLQVVVRNMAAACGNETNLIGVAMKIFIWS